MRPKNQHSCLKNWVIPIGKRNYIWRTQLEKKGKPILGLYHLEHHTQIFETHWTSKQHETHLKKTFHFKFYIKRLPESCNLKLQLDLQNFNFNIWSDWSTKMFQESNTLGSFVHEHKRNMFLRKNNNDF